MFPISPLIGYMVTRLSNQRFVLHHYTLKPLIDSSMLFWNLPSAIISQTASSLDINTFMATLYIIVCMLHILLAAKTNYYKAITTTKTWNYYLFHKNYSSLCIHCELQSIMRPLYLKKSKQVFTDLNVKLILPLHCLLSIHSLCFEL